MKQKIIYALKCPFTNEIHYVGKSNNGMLRPLSHLKSSHSKKINEWVIGLKELGYKPIVEILEYVDNELNIDNRELFYIHKYIKIGCNLLNLVGITPLSINKDIELKIDNGIVENIENISSFVKIKRKEVNLTQEEFAERTGVALTVIRKIEQGKTNINLNKLLNVLNMFGCTINVIKINNNINV